MTFSSSTKAVSHSVHVRHGLAELGGIDILVNKAAHQASFKSIEPLRMHNRQPPLLGPFAGTSNRKG